MEPLTRLINTPNDDRGHYQSYTNNRSRPSSSPSHADEKRPQTTSLSIDRIDGMATATVTITTTSQRPTHTRSKTWSPIPIHFPAMSTGTLSRTSSSSSLTLRPSSRGSNASNSTIATTIYSTGWYNADEENMSLEKIAERLNTYAARFERFLGVCAQNIVMALFRPTPLLIFLLHPLLLIVWVGLGIWWVSRWMTAG